MGLSTLSQFFKRAYFEYKWCFLPRRCASSNKLLWMTIAVRGTQIITGPGEPAVIVNWIDRNEFLILRLKGY